MIEMTMDRKSNESNGRREDQPPRKTTMNDKSSVDTPQIPEEFTLELVQLFKLLSDETRLRILLALLHTDEMHVRALCDLLDQSQPAVSHHLALLRVAGLIDRRRELHFKDYVLSYSPT